WPDIIINGSSGAAPFQIAINDDILLCISQNNQWLWTSEDNFATARSTGVGKVSGAIGRQIVHADGAFYFIGRIGSDNDNCVCVPTEDGINFGDSAPLPISSAYGIAALDPTADNT